MSHEMARSSEDDRLHAVTLSNHDLCRGRDAITEVSVRVFKSACEQEFRRNDGSARELVAGIFSINCSSFVTTPPRKVRASLTRTSILSN